MDEWRRLRQRVNGRIFDFLKGTTAPIVILYGGSGAGKSFTMAQYLIFQKALKERCSILVTRKYNPSLRLSCYKLITNILRASEVPFIEQKSLQTIVFPTTGSEMIFRGMDDPQKIKSTLFNYAWMEEATEFDFEDYTLIKLRLSLANERKNTLYLTFNPVTSWLQDYFFIDKMEPFVEILKVTYHDNPFLDAEYIKTLEQLKEQDEAFYSIYTLGEFAEIGDLVYTNFEVIRELPMKFDDVAYGIDFGFKNPTVILEVGLKDGDVYVIREFYQSEVTNTELKVILKKFKRYPRALVYCDPSEPARIVELGGVKANNDVKAGINFLRSRKIYINYECYNTIREIKMYSWKKKDERYLDEPVKLNDHAMDALRYATTGWWRLMMGHPTIATIKRTSITEGF